MIVPKKWLIAAAMTTFCAVAPITVVYAEENASPAAETIETIETTEPTETVETAGQIIEEVPTEQSAVEAAPIEQPAVEASVIEDAAVINPYAPTVPTLLTDRLAPETYETLEDPNVKIVLIDISDQYVWVFENGASVLESPMISGLANTRHETSRGVFKVEFKKHGKYLTGSINKDTGEPSYKTWVDYWMLFDSKRSIGLHDASWRSIEQYADGQRYLTDGSHGCINLPCDFAPYLYDFVEIGTPVIVQD